MPQDDDDYVYYKRGSKTMRMTRTAWELSGGATKENGITLVGGEAADTSGAKTDIGYNQLVQQAKGFEKDGQTAKALEKFKAAYALKDTNTAKAAIARLEKLLPPPLDEAKVTKAVEDADAAFKNGDYGVALELYTAANEAKPSEYLSSQIKACEVALAG